MVSGIASGDKTLFRWACKVPYSHIFLAQIRPNGTLPREVGNHIFVYETWHAAQSDC